MNWYVVIFKAKVAFGTLSENQAVAEKVTRLKFHPVLIPAIVDEAS